MSVTRSLRVWNWLALALVLLLPSRAFASPPVFLQGPSFGTYSMGQVQASLTATGGDGVNYTWEVIAGQLPPGVSLRTDRETFFPSNATAGLHGIATTPGTYNFTLKVTSGGEVSTQNATIKITALTLMDYWWNLPDGHVGVTYDAYTLTPLNNLGAVSYSINSGFLPTGMALSSTGTLSGTPGNAGFFNVQVAINDGVDTVFRQISFSVFALDITSPSILPIATQNQPYNATITASGGTPPYTFLTCGGIGCTTPSSGLPSGLSINTNTGAITGTPLTVGPQSVFATVVDSAGQAYNKYLLIDIVGVPPTLPFLSVFVPSDCSVGVPCLRQFNVIGGGVAPFTWSVSGQPTGMGIRGSHVARNGPAHGGELWGTPQTAGDYNVTITVTDVNGLSTSQIVPLHVSTMFNTQGFPTGTMGVAYSQKLRWVIGGESRPFIPGAAVAPENVFSAQITGGALPAGLTFDPATLMLTGTPLESGSFSLNVTFTDNSATPNTYRIGTSIFVAGLAGSTLQISTSSSLQSATVGSPATRTLTACCLPAYEWVKVSGNFPPGMTTFNATTGVFSGTPTTPGTYTFLMEVHDPSNVSNLARRQFTIVVLPVVALNITNASPLPYATSGSAYSLTFTASGNVGAVTYTKTPGTFLPPGLSISAAGVLSGTPATAGQYTISVTATDTSGATLTRSYSLPIYPAGSAPPLNITNGPTQSAGRGAFIQALFATGGANALPGQPQYQFSYSPGATPIPGVRIQNGQPLPTSPTSTGYLLGVIAAPGVYQTSIRVTDSIGQFFDKPYTVTVTPVGLAVTALPQATAGAPYSFTFRGVGGVGPYAFVVTSGSTLPSGLTLAGNGVLSGTPTTAGTPTISVTVTDQGPGGGGWSAVTGMTLTINAFAITTNGILPQGTVGTPISQGFSAPGCAGCTWSLASGSLPAGLTLNGSTAVISGTPTNAFNGSFTLRATPSTGAAVTKIFSWIIQPVVPAPLSITTAQSFSTTVGSTVSTLLAVSGGVPPYSWAVHAGDTLPTGIILDGPGEAIGNLVPGGRYLIGRAIVAGIYAFTIDLTDATNTTVTRTFTWNVSALSNQYTTFPVTGGPALTYNTSYSQPTLIIGGTGTYNYAVAAGSALPSGLSIHPTTGVISGAATQTGAFSTTLQVTDTAGNLVTPSINFTVAGPAGSTPLTFGTSPNLGFRLLGQSFTTIITPSGGTAPYTVTALTPLPPGATLQAADALFSTIAAGSVALSGISPTPGVYSFTLQAQDAANGFSVRTFTYTVASFGTATNVLPDATIGTPYSYPLTMFGTPATWSVTAGGAMPPGLSISPAGVISGTPTGPAGTFTLPLSATDANSGALIGFTNISLRISGISISGTLPPATVGVPYTAQLTASGGAGAIIWSATGLPNGLSINPATGLVSGTPQATGNANVQVTATDNTVQVTRRFGVTIVGQNVQLDLPLGQSTLADVAVGQLINVNLSPTGGVPPYSLSLAPGSALPPGLQLLSGVVTSSFIPGTTVLSGSPTIAGSYSFDIIVTDTAGTQMRRTLTMRVSNVSILNGTLRTAITGSPFSQQLLPLGGTPPYTFTVTGPNSSQAPLPPGLSLSASGLISGTATSTGNYSMRVTVQDGAGLTFLRTFTLTVNSPSGIRVTTADFLDGWVGSGRRNISLETSGTSTYNWTLVGGSLPPGVLLTIDDDGAPALGGAPAVEGNYVFTLRATDAVSPTVSADRTFTMHVSPMQIVSPPAGLSLSNNVDLPPARVGAPYSFLVKLAGGTPPYTFTPSPFVALPAGLAWSAAGVLSGTPQQSGNSTITAIVSDAAGKTLTISNLILSIAPSAGPVQMTSAGQDVPLFPTVGEPYLMPLGFLVRNGVPPYTFAVQGGSSLPAGLTIVPASGNIQSYVVGVPTTAGFFTTLLTATDAAGTTVPVVVEGSVTPLSLSPADALPVGRVGAAYSAPLTPTGGVAPYAVQIAFGSDIPPGLTFNGGTFTGTPTAPGTFILGFYVTDSASPENFTLRIYRFVIDNAGGQAAGLSLAPRPIQIYYETGAAAPAPIAVSVSSSSGAIPFSLAVGGVPGASLSSASGTTNATRTLSIDPTGLAVGTYVGLLAGAAPTAANQFEATPVTLTVAPAPPCVISVNPAAGSQPASGGAGSFAISGGPNCAWTATASDPSWIAIASAASGTGPTSLSYSVTANPGISSRNGTIDVAGSIYSITQFGSGCSFAVNPVALSATAAGGAAQITLTASNTACLWTATGLNATPASGTGSAMISIVVPPNPDPSSRVLSATLAGQTLTVNQAGLACTVGLSPYSASATAAGGSGSVTVTTPAGCTYDTVLGPSWVSVVTGASGTGSGTLVYSVDPNSTTVSRSGALTIGGQTFQITQDPLACSVTLNTANLGSPYDEAATIGTIGVTANGANCSWTASNAGAPWATLAPSSGNGNGTIALSIASNALSPTTRNGTLSIAGQTINISQAGTVCSYALQSTTGSLQGAGGSGAVGVITAPLCNWTASVDPLNASWLSITASGNGGSSDVNFTVQPNLSASLRTGTMTIAGQTYTLTQAAAVCTFTLTPGNSTVASTGVTGATFGYSTTATGCNITALSYANWLTVTGVSGGISGTVSFDASPNPLGTSRAATIQVGDKTFTVTQAASLCGYSLNRYGIVFGKNGGSADILASASALGCTPPIGTTQPSFIFLGPLGGPTNNIFTQPFTVDVYSALTTSIRTGKITFGGTLFTVKQTSY